METSDNLIGTQSQEYNPWEHMIWFIEFFEGEIAKILAKDHVEKTDLGDLSEEDVLDLGISMRKYLSDLPAYVNLQIKQNAQQLFEDFSKRRALVICCTPEEVFEKIFKTPPKEKIWIEVWLYSLHFYLQEEDFLVAYKDWTNAGGMHYSDDKFGSITTTRVRTPSCLADLNTGLLRKYGLYARSPYAADGHEMQHARYQALLGERKYGPSCVRDEDTRRNPEMAILSKIALNEVFAHAIEWRDTAKVWRRLLSLGFVVDTLTAENFAKNARQMSVGVFSLWYEYRRVIRNCIDFVDDVVRAHWSEKQKWIDKLTVTPVTQWYELHEWWKSEDFLMNFKWLNPKRLDEVMVEEMSFEKFPFPIRVINPPAQDRDMVVVIPSYDEGSEIIHALESIADQTINRKKNKISVFVVINQPSSASEKIDQSNKRTARLITDIWSASSTQKYSKREERKIRKIIASWLHISIVDLYSDWQSHQENNVWFARDVGGWTATEYLSDSEGYMVQIDADTLLDAVYLDCINWDDAGQSGNVVFRKDKTTEAANELDKYLSSYNRILRNLYASTFSRPVGYMDEHGFMDGYKSLFSGCNIVVNKKVFRDVGWFDHISGAEDVLFGMKVNTHEDPVEWYRSRISYNEDLTVYPKYRPSDRTQKWHGHGHEVIRKMEYSLDVSEFPVESHTAYLEKMGLTNAIETANHLELKKEDWMIFVRNSCKPGVVLSDEEISILFELSLKSCLDDPVHLNHHLERYIEDIVGELYPKLPLEESVDNIFMSFIRENSLAERLFGSIKWNTLSLKEKVHFLRYVASNLFQDLLSVEEMRDNMQFVSTSFKKENFQKDGVGDDLVLMADIILIYLNTLTVEIIGRINLEMEWTYEIDINTLFNEMYLDKAVRKIVIQSVYWLSQFLWVDKNNIVLTFREIFCDRSYAEVLRSMGLHFRQGLQKMQQNKVDDERIDLFVYINLLTQKVFLRLSEDITEKKRIDIIVN